MKEETIHLPEGQIRKLKLLGYRPLNSADYQVFDPYYDNMNAHWSCAAGFLSFVAWSGTFPLFYKRVGELLVCLGYELGEWAAIPFLGHYSSDTVSHAFRVLQSDMEALQVPLLIIEVSPWMLPFYRETGVSWEITDNRDVMDYVYQKADLLASMDKSDSRYRYRYFVRRYAPETIVLTKEHQQECLDCMETIWCPYRSCSDCHYGCPKEAISRVLGEYDNLQADGLLVRVNERAVGFCITTCRNGLGIYYFKYADNHLKGINEYLLRECFNRFLSGADEINYTDDMGIESLRAHKSRLSPYTLLPKLRLRETKR